MICPDGKMCSANVEFSGSAFGNNFSLIVVVCILDFVVLNKADQYCITECVNVC